MSKAAIHIRTLPISGPNAIATVNSKLKSNIIIVAKYSFEAENETELSISKGDILKLLDRPGSGWILVKFIDKVHRPGLVPASYVDIAVNDPINPITLAWLQEVVGRKKSLKSKVSAENLPTSPNTNNYMEWQIKNSLLSNQPVTINNRIYPIAASISNFLLFEDRYWYRVDITYSDHSKSYICRYYQDFYNLHISLLEHLSSVVVNDNNDESMNLPKLPEPIPLKRAEAKDLMNMLLKRCNDLHVYVNKLILNKHYQISPALLDWLDVSYNGLPGFSIDKAEESKLRNDEITEKVLPGSLNILKEFEKEKFEEKEKEQEEKDDVSSAELLKRSKSKNIYNHYQQISNIHSQMQKHKTPPSPRVSSSPQLNINTSFNTSTITNNSDRSLSEGSIFSVHQARSPESPVLVNCTPYTPKIANNIKTSSGGFNSPTNMITNTPTSRFESPKGEKSNTSSCYGPNFIKCKIMTPSNDIVAIKLAKSDIFSLEEFKRMIRRKINFTYLYIRLPNQVDKTFRNIDSLNFNLVEFVKHNDKVLLRIS